MQATQPVRADTCADAGNKDFRGQRLIGHDFSGRDLTGADFSGANLSGANLAGANLIGAVMRGAVLHEANLTDADLAMADLSQAGLDNALCTRVGLMGANLEGATIVGAILIEASLTRARLANVFAGRTNFQQARLREVDLTGADLTGADMRDTDLTGATVGGASFCGSDLRGAALSNVIGYEHATWVGADMRDINFAGAYLLRRWAMDENYLHEFRTRSRLNAMLYRLWWLTSDCGRSLGRWGLFVLALVLAFTGLYLCVDIDYGGHQTWLSPFYYSVVTITTLGYGDVLPASTAAQVVCMAEVVIGYLMLGGLLSIFSSKMARRAE